MAKLMIKAIGLFGLTIAYATGAWAACGTGTNPEGEQLEVCVVGGPMYAATLFGSGADDVVLSYEPIEFAARTADPAAACVPEGTNGPNVVIELPMGSAVTGDAEVRYTLHGAVLAQRVSNTDVSLKHATGSISSRVIDGGAPGDDFVVFTVETEGEDAIAYSAGWDPDGDGNDCQVSAVGTATVGPWLHPEMKALIAFAVPPVTEAAAAMRGRYTKATPGVRVSVEVDGTSVGGFPRYPARGQALDTNADGDFDDAADLDSGRRTLLKRTGKAGVALSGAAESGVSGTINPEMRETLLISTALPFPLNPQQLEVAGITVSVDTSIDQADGSDFSVADVTGRRFDGDGAGVLLVTVSGDFRDGDVLFWDNGNDKYDAGAELDIMLDLDDGTATGDFALNEIAGLQRSIIYVPNGEDPLRSGSIATTFSVEFSTATNAAPQPAVARSELNYAGAEDALRAYAIAPPSNPDDSNIRVRCDKSTPCQIYFACDGADGAGYFGKMDGMIGPRMVDTVNAGELADIIGAEDEDFAGRLSCEVIGTSINVQVLTRSGDSLVNNTYVGGPLEAQVRDAINSANAATMQARAAGASAAAVRSAQCAALAPVIDGMPDMDEAAALKAAGCE